MGGNQSVAEKSIPDFIVKDYWGKDVKHSDYKEKVLLIVNVVSKGGFTDTNYTHLSELHDKYKDKGFEILAFPCNQFLRQEPGSSEEVQKFACTKYNIVLPVFQKVNVNAQDTS